MRLLAGAALCAGLAVLLAGCSPSRLVSQLSPSAHLVLAEGIAYGDHPRQRLDLYTPEGTEAGAALPVVVFFYGGAWQRGERDKYGFVGSFLAEQGVLAVVPDYRVFPEARFPEFVHDGAAVLAWVRRDIARHGGDPGRILLMGHSAGAHIAALLALDRRYLDEVGVPHAAVQGLIGLSGPYRFDIARGRLAEIFARDGGSGDSQPLKFVTAAAPAALLLHGENDRVVTVDNSVELHASLCAVGVDASLVVYPGVGHVRIAAALAPPLSFAAGSDEDIAAFLARWTGREPEAGSPVQVETTGCGQRVSQR